MKGDAVYVTGMGIVTALGMGVAAQREALESGRSGIRWPKVLKTRHHLPLGEVPFTDEELAALAGMPRIGPMVRTALLGLLAAQECIHSCGLTAPDLQKTPLISSTTVGGMTATEEYFYTYETTPATQVWIDKLDCGDSTRDIAQALGIMDFCTTVSTACSSSANAIMLGARLIRHGLCERAMCGGSDALSRFTLNGFHSLLLTEKVPCRPFDKNRQGLNLGEGAAFLMLESAASVRSRGVQPLARVAGYANTNDAFHQTASSPDGTAAFEAMRQALDMAGLQPASVSYVNTHGTGTPNNDESEGRAMLRLFGENMPPFSSTKPFTGHTLAAAGAVEAIFSILSIQEGCLWPNLNFQDPMEDPFVVPLLTTVRRPVSVVVSNSFGFGGNNTSLVFAQPDA